MLVDVLFGANYGCHFLCCSTTISLTDLNSQKWNWALNLLWYERLDIALLVQKRDVPAISNARPIRTQSKK